MSDETLSPDHELASAYVDGQATAQERAQVEASPELLALVQTYRTMRTSLQAVPPPSAAVRDAALTAALATFDSLGDVEDDSRVAATAPLAPVAPPRPNVVSLDRRRRWNHVLTAAAAVAIVGVAGVALAGMFSGSSDDSASSGTALSADANTEAAGSSKVGVAGIDDTTTAGNTPDSVVVPSITGGDTQTTETIGVIGGGASPVPEYREPAALRSLPEPTAQVAPSFEFACPLESSQELVLEITWRGTPALVVRDTVTRLITVLDAQCTTLATVQP